MYDKSKPDDTGRTPVAQRMAEDWEDKYARERGIFTDTDRKYLFHVKKYENRPEAQSRRRGAIRERAVNGIRDLFYLPMIDEDQWADIFDELAESDAPTGGLRWSVSRLIAFLHESDKVTHEWLEETIAAGIDEAEESMSEKYRDGGASVDIDPPKKYDLNELEDQIDGGNAEKLSPVEVGVLVKAGRVDPNELAKLDTGDPSPWDRI